MAVVFKNNAKTTLASGLTSSATSVTVADGNAFPSLSGGDTFFCTFDNGTNVEVVKVTARSSNTLTIVRAQDDTTARAFSTGDVAELRLTAGILNLFSQTGVAITDEIEAYLDANGLTFPDNVKAIFGAGSDLQIYHDGFNSYIDEAGDGVLFIKSSAGIYLNGKTTDEPLARFIENGAVNLYYDNDLKLATTSTGIDVTGTINSGAITANGVNQQHQFLSSSDAPIITKSTDATTGIGFEDDSATNYLFYVGSSNHFYFNSGTLSVGGSTLGSGNTFNVAGGIGVSGQTVIDASRNLTNIGTISGTGISTGANLIDLFSNQTGVNELRLDNNRQDLSNVAVSKVSGYNGVEVANMTFYRGGGGSSGFIRFQNKPTNAASLTDVFQIGDGGTVGYGVNIMAGGLRIANTTVIDSSRNLTNIGTISSGAITSTGAITSSDFFKATGNNLKFSAGGNHIFNVDLNGKIYPQTHNAVDLGFSSSQAFRNLYLSGTITATGGNSTNWNTAYGWGNHASQSYATQSYVGTQIANLVDSSPAALNTLNELAAALGDDANFSTTTSTALGNRLRVDTAAQGLTGTQQANAITNLGITATKAELNYVDGVTSNIQTQLNGKQASGSYLTGNQTITLSGDVSGSGTTSIAVTIADDSHNHVISNVDGLQTALDGKLSTTGTAANSQLLDSLDSTQFLRSDTADIASGQYSFTKVNDHAIRVGTIRGTVVGSQTGEYIHMYNRVHIGSPSGWGSRSAPTYGLSVYGSAEIATDTGTLTRAGHLVWDAGNDGSGSGLDADLLDGLHASSFLRLDSGSATPQTVPKDRIKRFNSQAAIDTTSGSQSSLEVYGNNGAGTDAFMTFHVENDYALYFGLDGGTNKLSVGGWSAGAASYEIYHAGNKPSLATLGYTGATNANYITNNNQLTNGAGYLTSVPNHSAALITSGNLANARMSTAYLATRLGEDAHSLTTLNSTTLWSQPSGYQTMVQASTSSGLPSSHGQSYFGYNITSRRDTGTGYSALLTAYDNSNMWFTYNGNEAAYPTWRKVWHDGNDGSGSGLDADLLDGQHASAFLTTSGTAANSQLLDSLDSTKFTYYRGVVSGDWDTIFTTASNQTQTSGLYEIHNTASGHSNFPGTTMGITPYSYGGVFAWNLANHTFKLYSTHVGNLFYQSGWNNDEYSGWRMILDSGNYSGAGIWGATNDGSGSGLDADLLDGQQGSYYAPATGGSYLPLAGGTVTGATSLRAGGTHLGNHEFASASGTSTGYSDAGIEIREGAYGSSSANSAPRLSFHWGNVVASNISMDTGGAILIRNNPGTAYENFRANNIYANGTNLVWNTGNDGSGSGLDADTVDGIQASGFVNQNGTYTLASGYSVAQGDWGIRNTTPYGWIQLGPANTSYAHIYTNLSNFYFNVNTMYQNGNLIWGANNDGSGSGLDADLLDGQHGSYYAPATGGSYLPLAGGVMTGSIKNNTDGAVIIESNTAEANNWLFKEAVKQWGIYYFNKGTQAGATVGGYTTVGAEVFFTGSVGNGPAMPSTWTGYQSGSVLNVMLSPYNGYIYSSSTVYAGSSMVVAGNTVWHAGNDGAGSGLDADLLDGVQGTNYFRCDGTYPNTDMNATVEGYWHVVSNASNLPVSYYGHRWDWDHLNNGQWVFQMYSPTSGTDDLWFRQKRNFAAQTWHKVWTTGNDGSGSGLDADLLDGYNAEEGAVNNSIVKRDGTASIKAHGLSLMRESTPTTGISWYNEAYYNWQDYMAAAGATGCGPNGNLTAPTGLAGVTSWALRSRMEGVSSYGWNWETGSGAGGGATATSKMSLQAVSGNLQIAGAFTAGGNITAYSDEKLKDNVQVIKNAVEKVKQIRGVTFTRNDIEDNKRQAGVIAQEVEKVLPEVVGYDEDRDTKTVAYGNMVGLLIEAIKEQQELINKLTSRLDDIEKGE